MLALPTLGTEMVEIKTFGSAKPQQHTCEVVGFNIVTRDGRPLKIMALVVPQICDAITNPPIQDILRRHPHLTSLDLADGINPEPTVIDVLIGADHYWSLVSG
jgi:hypothetical protein